MKIAVTSASGQLGATIITQLIKEIGKNKVVGIARTPKNAEHLGIEIRQGDYNSFSDFDKALQGITAVLLVSGMDAPEKRIQQHRNVIEAANQNKVSKIVYTSIIGDETGTAFSPIVQSNRQTEKDIQASGLEWAIGRNGIYIEPDLEYVDTYVKEGEIRNCAGKGKCGYTSRPELSDAYARMLLDEKHNGQIYNLVGEAFTQAELADYMNQLYGTDLKFKPISVKDYASERKAELGDFIGSVIAGIYEGIQKGVYDVESHFEKATGRAHLAPIAMMTEVKDSIL